MKRFRLRHVRVLGGRVREDGGSLHSFFGVALLYVKIPLGAFDLFQFDFLRGFQVRGSTEAAVGGELGWSGTARVSVRKSVRKSVSHSPYDHRPGRGVGHQLGNFLLARQNILAQLR